MPLYNTATKATFPSQVMESDSQPHTEQYLQNVVQAQRTAVLLSCYSQDFLGSIPPDSPSMPSTSHNHLSSPTLKLVCMVPSQSYDEVATNTIAVTPTADGTINFVLQTLCSCFRNLIV